MGFKKCLKQGLDKIDVEFSVDYKEEMIIDIFLQYSQNLLGFVHRPNNFISIRKAWEWMPLDLIGVFRKKDELIGYVLGVKEGEIVKIRELCCPRSTDICECIKALERCLEPKHILFNFISRKSIVKNLTESGFKFFYPTLSVYMIKDLEQKQKIDKIQYLYGISEDKFQMTSIDYY